MTFFGTGSGEKFSSPFTNATRKTSRYIWSMASISRFTLSSPRCTILAQFPQMRTPWNMYASAPTDCLQLMQGALTLSNCIMILPRNRDCQHLLS